MKTVLSNSLRLSAVAFLFAVMSHGAASAQQTTPVAPVSQTTAMPTTGTPMTKAELKAQKKAQKQQEKAADANAKAAKSQAKAKKDQDNALVQQEKTAGTPPQN